MAKKTFVINRRNWLTGEVIDQGVTSRSLLRDEKTGFMCCLGQVCRQLGYRAKDLNGLAQPSTAIERLGSEKLLAIGLVTDFGDDTKACNELMAANDSGWDTRRARESKIRAGFKQLGHRIKFIGKYPDYERQAKRLHA